MSSIATTVQRDVKWILQVVVDVMAWLLSGVWREARSLVVAFAKMVRYAEITYAEFFIGVIDVCWGLILMSSRQTPQASGAYSLLLQVASPAGWGIAFAITGIFQVYATLKGLQQLRRYTSIIGAFLWMIVFLAILTVTGQVVLTGFYLLFFLTEGWVFVRLKEKV